VVRAVVLYDEAPDPERYAQHLELCKSVPRAAFRHGAVFGAPMGEPPHRYYAEFEWADMASFKTAVSSPEFAATGKDAMEMGVKFSVEFVQLEEL
jgi:EthD domain